jgi:hypothetical protein
MIRKKLATNKNLQGNWRYINGGIKLHMKEDFSWTMKVEIIPKTNRIETDISNLLNFF